MANFSFTNSGAIPAPQANPNAINPFANTSSNPVANALNNIGKPNMSTNSGPKYVPTPSLPTTPLKSTNITHPDGTNIISTYHTPDTSTKTSGVINNSSSDSTPKIDPGTGQPIVTGVFAPGTPQNTPTGTNNSSSVDTSTTTSSTPTSETPQYATGATYTGIANQIPGVASDTATKQNQIADEISQLRQNLQTDTGVIQGQPQELNFQIGRVNALQTQEAAKETALQGQLQNEIASGTQKIGALGTTAGLLQKSVVTPGQAVFDPATGQYTSASSGGGNPSIAPSGIDQSSWDNYVSMAANGQYTAIPSSITSNTNLSGQLNSAAKAQNPNYSPIISSAQGSATSSNVQTGGTSDTQTAASGYASTLPQYQQASTDFMTADQQANNLLSTLSQTGINSTNATDYNTTINGLASKLGSTQTTAFTTALTEAQQAYTKLLSSVGAATPTVNGEAATSVLNPSSTPAQIAESIDKLNQAAYAKLAPQYQQALTYYNQLHGTNASSIPGYPAPTMPISVSTNPPQGPDTSASNIGKAGVGALDVGASTIGGAISNFANKVLGL